MNLEFERVQELISEGCERCPDDCRVRNLREGTIGHYRQSYVDVSFILDNFNK